MSTIVGFDSSLLLSYYQAQQPQASTQATANGASSLMGVNSSTSVANSATANDAPPWDDFDLGSQQAQDAQILSTTDFINTSNVPLTATGAPDASIEQDNQKLFSLYQAVNKLSYLASMSQRSGMTAGQLAGFNTRFQEGLSQVDAYVSSTQFNNFSLQMGQPSSSVTSTVTMPEPTFGYTGNTIVSDANVGDALPDVSASDSFTISVAKGGKTTQVPIDLSQVQGPLTVGNIVSYVNGQLQADGFGTRFSRVITQGSINDPTTAAYGIQINNAADETISLSSASATPSLYLAGTSGTTADVTSASVVTNATTGVTTNSTTSSSDQQGRLIKLSDLTSDPQTAFNATVDPTTGNTTAQATAVDSQGNVYAIGNATGNIGQQLNQGTQDVYLTKYDSAGNLQWTKLLGSAASASGYSLATDPNGGVVVSGSTTADLTTTAVADGNSDSFVAKYDAEGNQSWVQQIQTLADNQANAVSVDSAGNIYIGGQVNGEIGAGQTNQGGSDAYLAKLNAGGTIVSEQQFGSSGNDQVSATTVGADGSLYVAGVQNGDAVLSKYTSGDITAPPAWQVDLGALQGGAIGGVAVSGNQVYVSGTTANANLTAGDQAAIANPNSGSEDAFVFGVTDQGSSATPQQVSYVGTSGTDQGGAVTAGPDGTVYLTGTTTGTFAGQTRNQANTTNAFVTALASDGSIDWTRQYGGADGTSAGNGIAIDTQGSSVLDALGLPRGTLDTNDQSVDLTTDTTLRAGDSFSIDVQGVAAHTETITIDPDETLSSLATKISGALNFSGSANVTYTGAGEALQIKVNPGVTASLVAGPADSDALARLGFQPGTLVNTGTSATSSTSGSSSTSTSSTTSSSASSTTSASGSSSSATKVFGLGLTGTLNISTASAAGMTNGTLMGVLSAITNAYNATNTPPGSSTTGASGSAAAASTGTAPAYLQAQISQYTTALGLFASSTASNSPSTLSLTGSTSSLISMLV